MAQRQPETSTFTLKDGTALRVLRWPSPTPTKDVMLIQHGLGEHAGRYQTWADELADLPVHLVAFDTRGHGKSGGPKGHAPKGLATLADDLAEVLEHVKATNPSPRVFLTGHSMGGAVVVAYATSRAPDPSIEAFVLSSPAMKVPRNPVISIKLAIGGVLGSLVPTLTMPSGLDSGAISSVAAEVERYRADPLVHDKISAGLGVSLVADGEALPAKAAQVTLPTVVWHGDADPIVDIEGTRAFVRGIGAQDVKFEEIKGGMHESHHETPERRRAAFDLLRGWLRPRLSVQADGAASSVSSPGSSSASSSASSAA